MAPGVPERRPVMSLRQSRMAVLPLLSCLLTLLASGDDFCVPRLLLLPTSPDPAVLPPDHPNTDFVEVGDPWAAQRSNHDTCDRTAGMASCPQASCLAPAGCSPTPRRRYVGHRASPSDLLNTPLRC
jgi:hypothetical protein